MDKIIVFLTFFSLLIFYLRMHCTLARKFTIHSCSRPFWCDPKEELRIYWSVPHTQQRIEIIKFIQSLSLYLSIPQIILSSLPYSIINFFDSTRNFFYINGRRLLFQKRVVCTKSDIRFYPAISTFAVQICCTNKLLLYSYYTNKLFSLRINFPGTL